MLKEIMPGIFTDEVRTSYFGVPVLNLSFVPGKKGERSLLVDSGLPESIAPECREALERDMGELGLSYDRLDCILTHSHRDHVGLASFLNRKGARVLINPVDMRTHEDQFNYHIQDPERRRALFHWIGLEFADRETYDSMWRVSDSYVRGFEGTWNFSFEPVNPGEEFSCGDCRFRAVPLPGHTRGHLGLLESDRKLLFSGDVLIHGTAPIVGDTGDYPEGLDDYLNSLRDVKHMYSDCLFVPGHGAPFRNPVEEIDTVVSSYLDKCSAMFEIVRHSDTPLCIRDVSVKAYGREGKELTDAERRSCILIWFKTSACLHFMKRRGLLKETIRDGVSFWTT